MNDEDVRQRIEAIQAQIQRYELAMSRSRENIEEPQLHTSTPTHRQQAYLVLDQTPQKTKAEEILQNFTTTVTALLQRFVEAGKQQKANTPITEQYEGRVEEDPHRFLTVMDHHIQKLECTHDIDKIAAVRAQLRGEAKRWAETIRNAPISYDAFQVRFIDEFDSPKRLAEAYYQLYAKAQAANQTAEEFISHKQALLARLQPNMGVETTVEVIISLLKPSLASRVIGARPTSLEDLIRTVRRIETEVNKEYQLMDGIRRTQQQPATVRTPCRWCQQWHLSYNCDQNPYRSQGPPQTEGHQRGNQGNGPRAEPANAGRTGAYNAGRGRTEPPPRRETMPPPRAREDRGPITRSNIVPGQSQQQNNE